MILREQQHSYYIQIRRKKNQYFHYNTVENATFSIKKIYATTGYTFELKQKTNKNIQFVIRPKF